jgi:hypothetical protein
MLNYKSVRSSEPQIRSNPALRRVNGSSGFQKRLSILLEPFSLSFPTFQIAKEGSEFTLSNHIHYAWVRPAHLRSTKIVISEDMPLILVDNRDSSKLFSLRIPFDKKTAQHAGPIILEGAWDAQDHILWIWDVLVWEKQTIWNFMTYSKRWEILKKIVGEVLDCGHPMSDAEVRLPEWESLSKIRSRQELDPSMSIEFQPEKACQRRQLFLIQDQGVKFVPKTHHERKQISEEITQIKNIHTKPVPVQPVKHVQPIQHVQQVKDEPLNSIQEQPKKERYTVAKLFKDTIYKLPDTYRLKSATDETEDLGIAAIRSLETSKRLRELIKVQPSVLVDILWVEPFQKYEIKKIHN